ncbi:MAG: Gfo/Idh/MocA family oxidoreductase [Proteobacteria bacterium]|nr:Gfo/Idh/MocA family oxidoreductase [Pseudomonadota bacterium]
MLQVGLVGGGFFSRFHIDAWQRLNDVNLVSIVDTNPETRQKLSQEFPDISICEDIETLLFDHEIDILDIATPPITHSQILKQVMGRVPMLICQKPFCSTLEQAQEIAELADRRGAKLAIHENFRFQPWYRRIKTILDEGILGELQQADFRLRPGDGAGPSAYLDRQPYFREMERFLIHETGIHWIDVFQFLFGMPSEIYADLRRANPAIKGEDAGYFIFGYDTGVRVLFDGNRLIDHAAENHRLTMGEFLIEGTKAVLSLDGLGQILIRKKGELVPEKVPYDFEPLGFGGDCVYHYQKHVVDYCLDRGPLENSVGDYLKNLVLEELVYQSSDSGRKQAVRL